MQGYDAMTGAGELVTALQDWQRTHNACPYFGDDTVHAVQLASQRARYLLAWMSPCKKLHRPPMRWATHVEQNI